MFRTIKVLAATALSLVLSGCISAEVDLDFSDGENVQFDIALNFSQQAYGLVLLASKEGEGGPCANAKVSFQKDRVICTHSASATIEEVIATGRMPRASRDIADRSEPMVLQKLGNRTARFELPLDFETPSKDGEGQEMEEMFLASLVGEVFEIRVRAKNILMTNGEIEGPGSQAALYIPMVEVMKPTEALPDAFIVEFEY